MTLQLRHEAPDDIAAIEAVTTAAFADAPHTSHTEQFIVRALRAANELTLSIVAEEHGQVVGRLVYERMAERPRVLYGTGAGSNYQGQALKLSKHFREDDAPRP